MAVSIPDPMETPTVSVTEAARLLGCGRRQAYEAIQLGTFPVEVIRIGQRSIRVSTQKLLDVLGLTPGDI